MVRGVFVNRATSHQRTLAIYRYFSEVSPTKRATTAKREKGVVKALREGLAGCSLVALTPACISAYRDSRLAAGKAANTESPVAPRESISTVD